VSTSDELRVSEEQVREEHLARADQAAHWLYLFGTIGVGTVAMLVLMALLER
jgi:hypothetical protein